MKFHIVFILFLFISSFSFSQVFEKGYIITNDNDTLHGFIANQKDYQIALGVLFKKENNHTADSLFPEEINSIYFESGKSYTSFPLIHYQPEGERVLAKQIVEGQMEMFTYDHKTIAEYDIFIHNTENNETVRLQKPQKKTYVKDGKKYHSKDSKFSGLWDYITNTEGEYIKKYSENKIKEKVITYNQGFQSESPLKIYEEPEKITHEITIGLPILLKEKTWRGSIFRYKKLSERNKITSRKGIIYYYWSDKENVLNNPSENSRKNFRWQLFNVIPLGLSFTSKAKTFQWIASGGIGAGILLMSDYQFEDFQIVDTKHSLIPLPAVNIEAGARIKLSHSSAISAKINPTFWGIFFMMGLEF